MYQNVMAKSELSGKATLSNYPSVYAPTLTDVHEVWVVNKRKMVGLSLKDRVRCSFTWEELRVEPLQLCIEKSHLRWLRHLFWMPP